MPESTEKEAFLQEYVAWEQFISGARYRRDTAFLRAQGEAIHARGLNAPFAEITFDFVMHREAATAPNTVVTRPHAEAA